MNIRPQDLARLGYEQLDELDHTELIPFVQENLARRNFWSLFYWTINVLGFLGIILLFWKAIAWEDMSFWSGLKYTAFGVSASLLLIPLHEAIHALAYKIVGAKKTSYDANWRQFYFMAIADKFVANRREFQVVALAPFVVISTALLTPAIFLSLPWQFGLGALVLTHASFCAGDFGLLSYFAFRRHYEVVTYDDKANKISFFFGKRSAEPKEEEIAQDWT
ncbi:MAG: DUF3267 domain-containing protein [Bacteroidota bacterium]